MTFNAIAEKLAVSSATVRLCVSKYYEGGIEKALLMLSAPDVHLKLQMMQKHGSSILLVKDQ